MLGEIQKLQLEIMKVIDLWGYTEKTPILRKEIITRLEQNGEKSYSIASALNALVRKGYIRRAYTGIKRTSYVQLRTV